MKNFLMELINPTTQRNRKRQNVVLVIELILVSILGVMTVAQAITTKDTTTAYILCQPGDFINCRKGPSTKSESIGHFETGDTIEIDGKTSNGFAHAKVALEYDEGWVYVGYLVFDEPEWMNGEMYTVVSNGRVACRKYVDGPRRCWVVDGSTLQVFWVTDEWAVTNRGFIRSEYLRKE